MSIDIIEGEKELEKSINFHEKKAFTRKIEKK